VLLVSILAILAALVVAGVFFQAYGVSAIRAYQLIGKGALGSKLGLAETVRRAIPLLLCGVGLTIAFRALFWNIGAEGQLLLGAVAAAGVALFSGLPDVLLLPAMFIAGFLAGALWGLIPAALKARLGINDVITTLMMNYIAIYLVEWLIHGPWKGTQMRGFAYTDKFPQAAMLPLIPGTRIHWPTLVLGLVLAVAAYILITRIRQGFEIRVVGENPDAARFAGISHLKTTLLVMFISGGLAGLAGVGEMAGIHGMLRSATQISMGYGYTAIIVAWLARRNPLAVIVTSLLFGVIMAGGDVIKVSLGLPFQLINLFNGLILFFLIGSELLMHYKISFSFGRR
jgi:simple sugar transport system permease protein